ncbi:hypothetical protein ACI77O_12200 [Pseudomonas tritici]|uniref:hypothetical protein n=1 Tax=Pseudomonas tritici TaxID=2745518 RepID=UPI00387AFCD1
MYRVIIEKEGEVFYQLNVSCRAYAAYQLRELARAAGEAAQVGAGADITRFQSPARAIRAYAL